MCLDGQALVKEQEVSTLLREETIEVVPALDKSPVLQPYFIAPGKGVASVLDLS